MNFLTQKSSGWKMSIGRKYTRVLCVCINCVQFQLHLPGQTSHTYFALCWMSILTFAGQFCRTLVSAILHRRLPEYQGTWKNKIPEGESYFISGQLILLLSVSVLLFTCRKRKNDTYFASFERRKERVWENPFSPCMPGSVAQEEKVYSSSHQETGRSVTLSLSSSLLPLHRE